MINVSDGRTRNGEITKASRNPKVLISLHVTVGRDAISVDRKAPKDKTILAYQRLLPPPLLNLSANRRSHHRTWFRTCERHARGGGGGGGRGMKLLSK